MNEQEKALFEKIRTHLDDESLADRFFEFLERCEAVDLGKFIEEIDDSNFSPQDWVEAFLGFDEWLTSRRNSVTNFRGMLGYIHCCQMMIATSVDRPHLQSFIIQCLTDYGFDAENASQS